MEQKVQATAVELYVEKLLAALSARGLSAEPVGLNRIRAINRAADSPETDPLAAVLNPGLKQDVRCWPDRDGELLWWWVWSGETRDAPPEYERLGPAEEVEDAADRIARVLALKDGARRDM